MWKWSSSVILNCLCTASDLNANSLTKSSSYSPFANCPSDEHKDQLGNNALSQDFKWIFATTGGLLQLKACFSPPSKNYVPF